MAATPTAVGRLTGAIVTKDGEKKRKVKGEQY
jgi:hypothetical protein